MGGERISAVARGPDRHRKRKKKSAGLDLVPRDGYWHIHGTLRARGRAKRERRSTGLPAREDTREAALAIKRQIETEFVDEVVWGIKPSVALGVAARRYLGLDEKGQKIPNQGKELAPTDLKIIQAAVAEFGLRRLNLISGDEWSDWGRRFTRCTDCGKRQFSGSPCQCAAPNWVVENRAPASIVRTMSPIRAFLRWCATGDRGWLQAVPTIELPKLPRVRHAKRRRVPELRPDLLVFLFSFAVLHLRAQLYTEWSTGARVSSILFGCRLCDLILAPERSQITFHDTKNNDSVTAHLHPAAAEVLAEYLAVRGRLDRREEALFLTERNRPYSELGRTKGWSGQNKTAFRGMIRRAVKAKRRAAAAARRGGDRAAALMLWSEAALLRQVTQHWLRHWFATHAMAAGMDLRSIGEQGGWRDYRSIQAYQHDVPEIRRRAVDNLPIGNAPIGTSLPRGPRSQAG